VANIDVLLSDVNKDTGDIARELKAKDSYNSRVKTKDFTH
jgi:hypothetical protein